MRANPGGDASGDAGATRLTRRRMLGYGLGGAAALYGLDRIASLAGGPTAAAQEIDPAYFEPFQVDVPRLPVLEPDTSGGVDRYEITMQEGTAEILHGGDLDPTPIWGYDGRFPGPTIRARQGRPVEVTQHNGLPEETTVHLHGGFQREESDGALLDYHIPAGGQRVYHYPNEQPAATLWYHDHVHGLTGPNMNKGLTAFYIVGSEHEERQGLPQDDYDVPLMIQDRSFNDDGTFNYSAPASLLPGFHGDTILVNGAIAPRMRVKRRLYRLRLLNASNGRIYRLVLGKRRTMHQIGTDGGLLEEPRERQVLTLAPAERADILIDFSQFRPGSELMLRNTWEAGPSTTAVMRFDVEGGGGPEEYRIPGRLAWEKPMPAPRRTRRLELGLLQNPGDDVWLLCRSLSAADLDEKQPCWTINGQVFDNDRVDERPYLYTTEDWEFINRSEHPHPMHLHGCHFRVLSIDGEPPHPADRGWKDTVCVPEQKPNGDPGRAVVRPYFTAFTGRFVFHCHTAEHSDQSMMGVMEIRDA